MNEGVAETLQRISKLKTQKQKVDELAKYKDSFAIVALLDMVYNPKIEFLLPETDPPYTPLPKEHDAQNVLKRDVRKMVYMINSKQGANLRQVKREQIFIELLEAVDPDDAKLLLSVKNKKLPFKGITKAVVEKAFPHIKANW